MMVHANGSSASCVICVNGNNNDNNKVKTVKGLAARTGNQRELVACCQVSQWSLLKAKYMTKGVKERKSGRERENRSQATHYVYASWHMWVSQHFLFKYFMNLWSFQYRKETAAASAWPDSGRCKYATLIWASQLSTFSPAYYGLF